METLSLTYTGPAALDRLLESELAFSPSIQKVFSSHLAMELVALRQLGASDDSLQRTFDDAARHAEPRDDHADLARRLREVRRDGIAATVAARAPDLVDAPGTALFHPVIRLAYALDVGHEGQVAAALLDWGRRRDAFPVSRPAPGPRRLPDVAADLSLGASGTWPRTFDLHGLARRPEVRGALEHIALDERTLDDISSFAIAAHVTANDFITLHLVTGARAVRTVSGWLDEAGAGRLAAATVPVMAIAYAAVGAPPLLDAATLEALRQVPLPSRASIAELAIADRDPHVVKLTDVALAEEVRTADPLYRYAAARVVGLVPEPAELLTPR
jgi:hypothetical protein